LHHHSPHPVTFFKTFPILVLLLVAACASLNRPRPEPSPRPYRVALVNAGVYGSLFNRASADLGIFAEIRLLAGPELGGLLARQDLGEGRLTSSRNFAEVAGVGGLDFALVLVSPPAAYPVGAVGLKSINWRTKTINTVPAVKIPEYPYEWLLDADNGWALIRTDPPGAYLEIDGKPSGPAPKLLMFPGQTVKIEARWDKKVVSSGYYEVPPGGRILIGAPAEYRRKLQKKGIYQRLKDADEKYGPIFYIGFYVVVLVGGIALLFYSPTAF